MQNYCVALKDVVHQLHTHFYGVFLAAPVYINSRQSAIDLLSTSVEESHIGLKCINDDRMHIFGRCFNVTVGLFTYSTVGKRTRLGEKTESGPDHTKERLLDPNDFYYIDKES